MGMTGGEDGHFGDVMVNKNSNGIKTLIRGESDDEIHGRGRERSGIFGWNNGEKGNRSAVRLILCRWTDSAAIDIVEDKSAHPGPEEMTANEVIGFVATGVASGGGIVEQLNKITTEGIIFGDIDTTATEYKSILDRPLSTKRSTGSR